MTNFRFAIVHNGKYGYLVEKYNAELQEWSVVIKPDYLFGSYPEALDAAIIVVDTMNCTGQSTYNQTRTAAYLDMIIW